MKPEPGAHESELAHVIATIEPTDPECERIAWERLDSLTKPPRSLGRLEQIAARIARVQGTPRPSVANKAVILAAADHGVVAEGVSPYPQDVTWQMVANFISGGAAINQIARSVGAKVLVYDVGVAHDLSGYAAVIGRKVAAGTHNMVNGPAMSREQCAEAVRVGIQAAADAIDDGSTLIGTGEMGIGNSTAAAALTAAYAGREPLEVVGPGTGLDGPGVAHKARVVEQALAVNGVERLDALGVLAAVGGFEIAALAGVMIGCAARRTACVIDGYISGAAALAACALCPQAADYLLASHLSAEPGHRIVLDALGLEPVFTLDMRLGEGTGAALAFGVIDAACAVLSGMATFAEAGVSGAE